VAPPQSTSVSVPLRTPSAQVGVWQTFPEQTPPAQSDATAQPAPSVHVGHIPPPQSTSVSGPFSTPSLHAGA
jgi:hypothetical protein